MTLTSRSYSGCSVSKPLGKLKDVPLQEKMSITKVIENIVLLSSNRPLNVALEMVLTKKFNANNAYCFLTSIQPEKLYCATLSKCVPLNSSIISTVFNSKEVKYFATPASQVNYNISFDPSTDPCLYIPILNGQQQPKGVVVVSKKNSFSNVEIKKATSFCQRFSYYYDFIVNSAIPDIKSSDYLLEIRNHFGSRAIDLFQFEDNQFQHFNQETGQFDIIQTPGAALYSLQNNVQISLPNVRASPSFNQDVDGNNDEPVLVQPFAVGNAVYAVVLRGKSNSLPFSTIDCMKIDALAPILTKQFDTVDDVDGNNQQTPVSERLQALLAVAEVIFGVLDLDSLLPTIMDTACNLLNTERCSLFILDKTTNELVTRFHGGLDTAIRVKNGVGIAGYTASSGECVNITDAYSDSRFDKTSDIQTGFKTRSLLTVPIYDNRGAVAGVTEMINRKDGKSFDDDDIKMMVAFNVFCGISIDNANLYNTSLQLMNNLKSFIEASAAMGKDAQLNNVIHELISTMKGVINGSYAACYVYDNDTEEITLLDEIGKIKDGEKFADIVIKSREQQTFNFQEADEEEIQKISSRRQLTATTSTGKIQGLKELEGLNINTDIELKKIIAFPLLTNDNAIIGTIQIGTNHIILPEDMKLLNCFCVFAALSIDKDRLRKVASVGASEARIRKYLMDNERDVGDIPKFLTIEPTKQDTLLKINFDAQRWDGIGHLRVVFYLMNYFGVLKQFKVRNDTFLHFLDEISNSYNKVPYHNWRHAVDVTQFVSYQLVVSGVYKILKPIELYALLIAAICHDVNHDGFTNVYNEKAETPLGILFKNQSVMETHHCQVAIQVVSNDKCNIFSSFDSPLIKQIWSLIIALILKTDMGKHHSTLEAINKRLDEGPLKPDNEQDRFMMMELILKCSDISNVSRPFELADKWCDVLCEEFFRQGDLEKTSGMEYTSPLNDRAHLDKPKSQIGFYTFVCLPLFVTAARAMPALQVNVDQVNSNLAIWKSHHDQNNQ
ncbi:3'5'-cyclic nucleotide phosphodiesterase family protein [Trichomonas vaginalis G3]|uniref:Phosphodiesterase n=1 Tax=Trichomonas vaginalis (strain ATCC PRA-98 / G3) TaxID=412133 RepID=A2DJF3_TRIV3|nr:cyclic nucleotide phosphodiesterase family [Trichomonas vaginalis G3]EAY19540.1 3'5'-cyclic nucleotide phosphodiesterase family protein [Trichomonas vaginalis G3]KAI5519978.1 cyclic nucleotide phosphodiesterase family [Trichomonas vaginalis G3]|eukprot:XP_001580526.1 3'5'-cyclic nucleotide phosphodiesterase family protein [Trichomonas vaginalis G3]